MLTDGIPPPKPRRPRKIHPWHRIWVRRSRLYWLRQFPRKKRLHGTFIHRVLGNRLFEPGLWVPTRDSVAKGMALGILIGMLPLPGMQIIVAFICCYLFRINVTTAVLATFISNPLTGLPILWMQVQVGNWIDVMPRPEQVSNFTGKAGYIVENGRALLIGSLVTGLLGAIIAYPLTLLLWTGVSKATGKGPKPVSAGDPFPALPSPTQSPAPLGSAPEANSEVTAVTPPPQTASNPPPSIG